MISEYEEIKIKKVILENENFKIQRSEETKNDDKQKIVALQISDYNFKLSALEQCTFLKKELSEHILSFVDKYNIDKNCSIFFQMRCDPNK